VNSFADSLHKQLAKIENDVMFSAVVIKRRNYRRDHNIFPNRLVQPGPTHVVPLLTARLTKALGRPPGGILLREQQIRYNVLRT
jgi:hypothetical protein